MIDYFLNPQSVEALGWTLLHSLWQGAIFAILSVLILIAMKNFSAQSRYIVSVGLLCAFFITLAGTFCLQWQETNHRLVYASQTPIYQQSDGIYAFDNNKKEGDEEVPFSEDLIPLNSEQLLIESSSWLTKFRDYYDRHLPLMVTIWILGILFLQLRLLGQLVYVQRLKHYGTQLFPTTWSKKIKQLESKIRIRKTVLYRISQRVESPMVIGWLKPVILIPYQLLKSLKEAEVYAVLAHELAHIRREDFIVNLIQTVLCNIFFFHPGVWWMSNRIDDEREHCCDDLAVAAIGQATSYAKTLINMSELQIKMQANSSLSMAFSGKSNGSSGFSSRIHRLFIGQTGKGTFKEGFTTAFILLTTLFLGAAATGSTISNTNTSTQNEEIKSEVVSSSQNLNVNELKQGTETIISSSADNELPSLRQVVDLSELPVAEPVTPAAPEPHTEPVISDITRIDALIMASRKGDIDFVKAFVKTGIDVNSTGTIGFTPLMMATRNGEYKMAEFLLEQGADVEFYQKPGSLTAISMAASQGNLECLKLLVENGADVNGSGQSSPPLHFAARKGHIDILEFLLTKNIDINKKDAAGRTALMYAVSEGEQESVSKLIEAGAGQDNVNKRTLNIHQATLDGLIEKVQQMVAQGKDVNTIDYYGRTPLHISSAEGHNIDMKVLIELGAEINIQDNQGRTPLMYAAAAGKKDAVILLVSQQANIDITDVDGMKAYDWGLSGGDSDLVEFLGLITETSAFKEKYRSRLVKQNERAQKEEKTVQREEQSVQQEQKTIQKVEQRVQKRESFHVTPTGVHLQQFNLKKSTPTILKVVRNGSIADLAKLLKNDQTVNEADDTGQTALMVAASTNRLDIAEFLIEEGADVNMSSATGLTALHYAALGNNHEIARLLLNNNAIVDPLMHYSSSDGKEEIVWEYMGATPLLIAVELKNIEMISVLIDAGANTNQTLIRNKYRLIKNNFGNISGNDMKGLEGDFLQDVKILSSDETWTPYKQALLVNESEIQVFFRK